LESFIEKRKQARVEVRWPIKIFTDDGPVEGETLNISFDGISITCEEPLAINKIFTISIEPLNQSVLELRGKIIWSDSYGIEGGNTYAVGVSFVEISDEDRHRFEKFSELVSYLFR
jgi:hypothetical protein